MKLKGHRVTDLNPRGTSNALLFRGNKGREPCASSRNYSEGDGVLTENRRRALILLSLLPQKGKKLKLWSFLENSAGAHSDTEC